MAEENVTKGEQPDKLVVFSCSGASDVGGIADQAARILKEEKSATMSCIVSIAAGIPEMLEKAKSADRIVTIDGCPHHCARKVLEMRGFTGVRHMSLENIGMEKGKTPVSDSNVDVAADVACALCRA